MLRQPLSSLSGAALNSRSSVGAGASKVGAKRYSVAPTSSSAASRPSLSKAVAPSRKSSIAGRTSLSRRSSAYGRGSGVKDTRPIQDKEFIQNSIRQLLDYLVEHGYEYQITPKMLNAPAGKEFRQIFQFLYHRIDPQFAFSAKFEDDVITIFKKLKYPSTISKTSLHAVGSPHTWPALLASLAWLTELLKYKEEAQRKGNCNFDGCDNDRVFFDYISNRYHAFLAGRDEQMEELKARFQREIESRFLGQKEEADSLQEAHEEMSAEVKKMTDEPSPLESIKAKLADLKSDKSKFEKLIDNLKTYKGQIEKRNAEKKAELDIKRSECDSLVKENADLQRVVDEQEMSVADVQRIRAEQERLRESLASVRLQKEEADQGCLDMEMSISKRLDEVEKAVASYNAAGERAQLVPSSAKYADGENFQINLGAQGSSIIDQAVNIDLRTSLRPGLIRVKEIFVQRIRAAQEEYLNMQDKVTAARERLEEKTDDLHKLDARLKKTEALYQGEKEENMEILKNHEEEIQRMEEEIRHMKIEYKERLRRRADDLDLLSKQYDQMVKQMESQKSAINEQIITALDFVTNHKVHLETTLSDLTEYTRNMTEELLDE